MTHLELLKFAQALLAENIDLRNRLADTHKLCDGCGKASAEGWALYCVSCCDETIVDAAVAEEREACARVCERISETIWRGHETAVIEAGTNVCNNAAAAIRARGDI